MSDERFQVKRQITLTEFADGTWSAMRCDFAERLRDREDPEAGIMHVASCDSPEDALSEVLGYRIVEQDGA